MNPFEEAARIVENSALLDVDDDQELERQLDLAATLRKRVMQSDLLISKLLLALQAYERAGDPLALPAVVLFSNGTGRIEVNGNTVLSFPAPEVAINWLDQAAVAARK